MLLFLADMLLHMVANMGADRKKTILADMELDMVADMVADKKERKIKWPTWR